jgi:hypothetical protein
MNSLQDYDSGDEPKTIDGGEGHSKGFVLELNPSEIDPTLHSEVSILTCLARATIAKNLLFSLGMYPLH